MSISEHRFKIGDAVSLTLAARMTKTTPNMYEVEALLPSNGTHFQYRIRNQNEPFQRVAPENHLIKNQTE